MLRSFIDLTKPVALLGFVCVTACGCSGWKQSTTSGGGITSMFQPKVSRVSYEESIEELPAHPNDPVRLKLAYARWMEEVDQPHEARNQYAAVINKDPENVEAILGLARLDLLAGNSQEAERRLLQASKLAPENAPVQFELGRFYSSQGRWQESIAPLQKAMLNDPLTKVYRHQLAVAQVHVGDIKAAIPNFSQTVGDAEAHYNVALILKEKGDMVQAEQELVMALSKRPDFEPAQRWLSEIRRQRGGSAVSQNHSMAPQGGVQRVSASLPAEHSFGRVNPAMAIQSGGPAGPAPTRFEAPRPIARQH